MLSLRKLGIWAKDNRRHVTEPFRDVVGQRPQGFSEEALRRMDAHLSKPNGYQVFRDDHNGIG